MQTTIQALGFSLTDAIANHVNNRLGFTFSHTSGRVRRVNVWLSDLNGPRGGIDKSCLIEVRLDGLPAVIVEDVQPDMYTAIDRAIGRASRSVLRRLSVKNSKRRHQAVQLAHHASPGL